MVDKKATVRFLQFIKLYKVKPTAGIDDLDFWKRQQSYTDQTLKHKMQNFHIMDELPTHFALLKHLWAEIYLTDISLSRNMDLFLFNMHCISADFALLFGMWLNTRKMICFILTAALWFKWGCFWVKRHSSVLESNGVCSEIISECKSTAQNKTIIMGSIEPAEKCPVKANSPRNFKSNQECKIFL